jgi:hypothetical protein
MTGTLPRFPGHTVRAPKSLVVFQIALWTSLLLLLGIYLLPTLLSGAQRPGTLVPPPASAATQQ